MKILENGAVAASPAAGARAVAGRLGSAVPLAMVLLVPLALWLGFAENFEVPKFMLLRVLAFLAWAITLVSLARRNRLLGSPVGPALIVLAVSVVVSCAFSGSVAASWVGEEGSWQGAANITAILLAAITACAWLDNGGARKLSRAVFLAAGILLLYMLVQALKLDPIPWSPHARSSHWLFSALGNPVHLANYLALAFWLTFAFPPRNGWLGWAFRGILLAAILSTRQESALVAIALAAGVFMLIRRGNSLSAGIVAASFALCLFFLSQSPWQSEIMGARPEIWRGAAKLVRSSPLTGIGPGLFYSRFPYVADYAFFVAEPPVIRGETVSIRMPASPHNEILATASGQGLLGLGVYVWVLLTAWRSSGGSPLVPAAVSLWAVHLVNPSCAATSAIFWLVLAAASQAGKGNPGRLPAGRLRALAFPSFLVLASAVLLAGTITALRTGLAQAYRREANRLAFYGESAKARRLIDRWSRHASSIHPKQAYEDALLLRSLWKREGDEETARRIIDLLTVARNGNPHSIFYAGHHAYFEFERAREMGDDEGLHRSENAMRRLVEAAPGILCLRDDLAEVLAARGKIGEAEMMRASRETLDKRGVFRPGDSSP